MCRRVRTSVQSTSNIDNVAGRGVENRSILNTVRTEADPAAATATMRPALSTERPELPKLAPGAKWSGHDAPSAPAGPYCQGPGRGIRITIYQWAPSRFAEHVECGLESLLAASVGLVVGFGSHEPGGWILQLAAWAVATLFIAGFTSAVRKT